MSKKSVVRYICFGGILVFITRLAITAAKDGFRLSPFGYFFSEYMTVWGAIFVVSCLGLVGLLVSNLIKKRRAEGKNPISNGYTVSFILSYVPYVLLLLYCAYCSKFGFRFFSVTYGWEGFWSAFIIMGAVFCVIPVLPFCLFWQILYLIKWIRNRNVKTERG
ncbi:MAG: hypothetical protein J6X85_00365 [Ruminococcus sp.]|nr:hypothetical protein [Ruminococcus sp.]